jgi:DNA-binding CsgD family transcriptional regulator
MSTTDPVTYPLGWHSGTGDEHAMALLALSHTVIEHRLYRAMLSETSSLGTRAGNFSVRRLMSLTGLKGYNSVHRGLTRLSQKLSIERPAVKGPNGKSAGVYVVFNPDEIFARRRAAGLQPIPKEIRPYRDHRGFSVAMERVVGRYNLSRREAQVALCCVEGLTNAEIGERLLVSTETVKFHLRRIFLKFGVRRRTELVSRLLMPESELERLERS